VILPPTVDELGRRAPAIEPLDQVVSEASAVSEGARTILVLDQLQAADFRDHLRKNRLIRDCRWTFRDACYYANPKNLLLFLISEEALYHGLQKVSFRVWVNRVSEHQIEWDPADFGLGSDAEPLFRALAQLFRELGAAPTRSEMEKILQDAHQRIRNVEHLRHSLYGWSEDMDRDRLFAPAMERALERVVDQVIAFLATETIELTGDSAA
jgi:hypothetical protein